MRLDVLVQEWYTNTYVTGCARHHVKLYHVNLLVKVDRLFRHESTHEES